MTPDRHFHLRAARWPIWLAASGLAACVHYQPQPIDAAATVRDYEARSLNDTSLQSFIRQNSPEMAQPWPRPTWNPASLTLAAFYFHPSLDVARAQVEAQAAAVVTAGARANPTVAVGSEYSLDPGVGASPWLLGINFDIPLTTAGKRGLRIQQARQLAEAAKLSLAETGWQVRSGVRSALLEHGLAISTAKLLEAEIGVRTELGRRMEQRLAAGDVSRTEVDAAQVQLVQSRASLHTAQGKIDETRVALASAAGLSAAAFDGVNVDWSALDQLPDTPVLAAATIQTEGLLNRLDVRRALLDYAASEQALRLEIAKQFPDVHLAPGYAFDRGEHRFAVGVSVELPLLNRNQGPIAAAEAHRRTNAAKFVALQAQVIGALHTARTQYLAARGELADIDTSLTELQTRTERLTRRAVELGETDRLALASVQLQRITLKRARLDALHRAQVALGALEDAVQRPLTTDSTVPEVSLTNPRVAGTHE